MIFHFLIADLVNNLAEYAPKHRKQDGLDTNANDEYNAVVIGRTPE